MAYVGARQIGVRETQSTSVTIPDNDIARLMYYLSIIDGLINIGFTSRIKDYTRYYDLSYDEKKAVVAAAIVFSLDIFIKHNVIIVAPQLCSDGINKFYEITDTRVNVVVDQDFVVGEHRVRVTDFVAIKEYWAMTFFVDPLQRSMHYVQQRQQESRAISYQSGGSNYRSSSSSNYYSSSDDGCCYLL